MRDHFVSVYLVILCEITALYVQKMASGAAFACNDTWTFAGTLTGTHKVKEVCADGTGVRITHTFSISAALISSG